jgi:hypothetical protein
VEVVAEQTEKLVQIRLYAKKWISLTSSECYLHVLFATQIVDNQWRNCRKNIRSCPQVHLVGANIQLEWSQQLSKQELKFVGPVDEKWRFLGQLGKDLYEDAKTKEKLNKISTTDLRFPSYRRICDSEPVPKLLEPKTCTVFSMLFGG